MRRAKSETPVKHQVRGLPGLKPRRHEAHKGEFGRVLVIGGSRGMIGAPALVANAALRSGAGLVTVACPRSIQPTVAGLCPCATSIPLPENNAGCASPIESLQYLRKLGLLNEAGAPSVFAAGPGLGQSDRRHSKAMVDLLLTIAKTTGVPVVLDADALNALATSGVASKTRPVPDYRPGSLILTPHPGEMARLHGVSTSVVQKDREGHAVKTAKMMTPKGCAEEGRAVVVLKGAGTIVTNGDRCYVNGTGNPGMATGGSGDVLTGVIAALVGQGLSTFDAAVLGVHVHGLAGDLAARELGQVSLIATDLIDFLPAAWQAMRRQR